MSPGDRTIPAAMVFPIAAAMPNHMPSTWRSLPLLAGRGAVGLEDGSKVVDNEGLRGFPEGAIITVHWENASQKTVLKISTGRTRS
jgi:hypothetical protein